MNKLYTSKDLVNFLLKYKFVKQPETGSSHSKYRIPSTIKVPKGEYPFIDVVFNKKPYIKHTCSGYITQLKRMGFTKKQIEEDLIP